MLNQAQIIGRVGKQPLINYSSSGEAIASFSVATTEKWKDKATQEKKESTEWHYVIAFGRLAEIIKDFVNQGDLVYVCGKLITQKYLNKHGQEAQTTKIKAADLKMLSGKREVKNQQDQPLPVSSDIASMDDDIPF